MKGAPSFAFRNDKTVDATPNYGRHVFSQSAPVELSAEVFFPTPLSLSLSRISYFVYRKHSEQEKNIIYIYKIWPM